MNLKEIPKISCIYKIVNKVNKKYYLGSTINLYNRMHYHLGTLRKGTHVNDYLQASFNKYGEDAFEVEVVQKCSKSKLLKIEQKFLDKLPGRDKCFNISKTAGGGDNYSNHPNKEIIYQKLMNILTEVHKDPSKRPDFKGKKNPNYGNKWSKKQRKAMSKRQKQKYKNMTSEEKKILSDNRKKTMQTLFSSAKGEEMRKKMSKNRKGKKNAFYGKKHSKKSLEKMSKSHKGQIPTNRKKVEIEGIVYDSIHHAAKALQMNMTTVYHRIKSGNPKFLNWKEFGTIKEVETKKITNKTPLLIEGKIYKTTIEASKKYRVTLTTIIYRVRSKDPKWDQWQLYSQ